MRRRINKNISIIIILSVMLVLISSVFFIFKHTDHHCEGKNCSVCTELELCQRNIQTLGTAFVTGSFLIAFVIGIIAYIIYALFPVSGNNTLISLKVELLD